MLSQTGGEGRGFSTVPPLEGTKFIGFNSIKTAQNILFTFFSIFSSKLKENNPNEKIIFFNYLLRNLYYFLF